MERYFNSHSINGAGKGTRSRYFFLSIFYLQLCLIFCTLNLGYLKKNQLNISNLNSKNVNRITPNLNLDCDGLHLILHLITSNSELIFDSNWFLISFEVFNTIILFFGIDDILTYCLLILLIITTSIGVISIGNKTDYHHCYGNYTNF